METVLECKVFKNGGSNAIRLPASLEITGACVYLVVDEKSGSITLRKEKPNRLAKFFELQERLGPIGDDDWLIERNHNPSEMRQSIKDLIAD